MVEEKKSYDKLSSEWYDRVHNNNEEYCINRIARWKKKFENCAKDSDSHVCILEEKNSYTDFTKHDVNLVQSTFPRNEAYKLDSDWNQEDSDSVLGVYYHPPRRGYQFWK